MENNNLTFKNFFRFCSENRLYYRDKKAKDLYCEKLNLDDENKENLNLILKNYLDEKINKKIDTEVKHYTRKDFERYITILRRKSFSYDEISSKLSPDNLKTNKPLFKRLMDGLLNIYLENGIRIEEMNKDLAYEFLHKFKEEYNLNDQEMDEVKEQLEYVLGGALIG